MEESDCNAELRELKLSVMVAAGRVKRFRRSLPKSTPQFRHKELNEIREMLRRLGGAIK